MNILLLIQGFCIPLWSGAPRRVSACTVNKTGMTTGVTEYQQAYISHAQLVNWLGLTGKTQPLQFARLGARIHNAKRPEEGGCVCSRVGCWVCMQPDGVYGPIGGCYQDRHQRQTLDSRKGHMKGRRIRERRRWERTGDKKGEPRRARVK